MISQRIEDEDDIGSLLESRLWEITVEMMFRKQVNEWKRMLLTNQGLDEGQRKGYILARQTILETFQTHYKKFKVDLPIWLEE